MIKLCSPQVGVEELFAVKQVFKSGWLAEGKKTLEFEKAVCEFVGCDHAVAVCNATVGIELCLRALEITGCVATSAFGHPATPRAILNADAHPVFVDVNLDSCNMDYKMEGSHHVDAVVPVSLFGNPEWSIDGKPAIVEDASCSLGSSFGGKQTGSFAFPSVFSLHPRKLITTGEGGIVTTNDKALADKIRKLKNFGRGNYKFDDIRAAIGIEQLKKLPDIIEQRRVMAKTYNELLKNVEGVKCPKLCVGHTFQTYTVYLEGNRDDVIDCLRCRDIESQIGAHFLPVFKSSEPFTQLHDVSNSLLLANHLLALPMDATLTAETQAYVVTELKKAIQ